MGIIARYAVFPVYTHPHHMAQNLRLWKKKRPLQCILKSVHEYDSHSMPASVKFLIMNNEEKSSIKCPNSEHWWRAVKKHES